MGVGGRPGTAPLTLPGESVFLLYTLDLKFPSNDELLESQDLFVVVGCSFFMPAYVFVCLFGVRVCVNVTSGYAVSCHWLWGGGGALTCCFKVKKTHMKQISFS